MKYTIHQGDNRETLKTLADNSVDAVVTDPPYGIDFLGKDWDANTGALETYRECLRVLKPGGYILAFSAARTYHHLAVTLEQAGFEIRDQIMWLYSSGFPKAQDIGKAIQRRQGVEEEYTIEEWEAKQGYSVSRPGETMGFGDPKNRDGHGDAGLSGKITKCTSPEAQQWSGWKTHLKPAHEPIAMARKPFKGSTIDNVLEHGLGALNIDATRIPLEDNVRTSTTPNHIQKNSFETINTDEQKTFNWTGDPVGFVPNEQGRYPSNVLGAVEGYQKFFYCPKVSRKERHIGYDLDGIPTNPEGMYDVDGTGVQYNAQKNKILKNWEMVKAMGGHYITADGQPILEDGDFGNQAEIPGYGWINLNGIKSIYDDWCKKNGIANNPGNNHPTVKPVELMKYLIKLVTPPNSVVLDPFTGSGSTGMAAVELGHTFIGCELDPAYVEIARRRIEAWNTEETDNMFKELFDELF